MLIVVGALLLIGGVFVLAASRFGLPLGRLPGDIAIRGKNFAFYAPITTCLLVSAVLSLLVWVVGHWRR
jgi:hypothetical protein